MNDKTTKTIQSKVKTMNLSNKYREERKSHNATKNDQRTLQIKYDNLMELHNGVVNDYHEQAKVVEDLRNRYNKECTNYTEDEFGNVTGITKLPAYRGYMPIQILDNRLKYINTTLYQQNVKARFVSRNNGRYIIDEKKYKIYLILGGLI